jgi:hypothetical protein
MRHDVTFPLYVEVTRSIISPVLRRPSTISTTQCRRPRQAFTGRLTCSDSPSGPINLGNPSECSILDLAEQVIALSGSQSRLVRQPLPEDDPKQRCPDISKARSMLGWEPATGFVEGLKKTIDYFDTLLSSAKGSRPVPGPSRETS